MLLGGIVQNYRWTDAPTTSQELLAKILLETYGFVLCIAKIGGGFFLIHSTELLHSNIPDFFVGCLSCPKCTVLNLPGGMMIEEELLKCASRCFFFLGGGQDVSEYKPAVPFGHWYVICCNGFALPWYFGGSDSGREVMGVGWMPCQESASEEKLQRPRCTEKRVSHRTWRWTSEWLLIM